MIFVLYSIFIEVFTLEIACQIIVINQNEQICQLLSQLLFVARTLALSQKHYSMTVHRLLEPIHNTVAVWYHADAAHGVWPFHWLSHDELHQVEDGVCVERRRPRVELIKDATKRPEISSVVIWLLLHQLRGHV